MGVYIKGMEMPTDCIRCPFCDYEQGFCLAANEMDTAPREIGERHKDCPLVELPPHGRLIDADDTENITVIMNDNGSGFNRIIAPTIIPAEEGEQRSDNGADD